MTCGSAFDHAGPLVLAQFGELMQIFVYEFVTSGGFFHIQSSPPSGSLLSEGQAMASALGNDFRRIEGVRVVSMRDVRLTPHAKATATVVSREAERRQFEEFAKASDWTLAVAPELDGHLTSLAEKLERWDCRSLGVDARFCRLTSDKTVCCDRLADAGLRVPRGMLASTESSRVNDLSFPIVMKPNDGAGSTGLALLERNPLPSTVHHENLRMEEHVPGMACSVNYLCHGGDVPVACPPMFQHIDYENDFAYRGGSRIRDQGLVKRATQLGHRALAALPTTTGWVGVDLVLGARADGSQDYVIEVNPRITTSYVGVQRLTRSNLARAMISLQLGLEPHVDWFDHDVAFLADGTLL